MQQLKNRISYLIVLYIKGDLDNKQQQELEQWLQEKENRKLFNTIISKENILNKSLLLDNFDREKAWEEVEKQLDTTKEFPIVNFMRYAAVAIILVAASFALFNITSNYKKQANVKLVKVYPGKKNAIIHFASGEVVDLMQDTSKVIQSRANVVVHRKKNVLQIKSDTVPQLSNQMNRIVTPIGGEYQVVLPDGTKVWLNADSELKFPSLFSDKQRKVIAKGEVFFDVTSNKQKPFIVETSNGIVLKVLGTQFNVRAYADETNVVSTLVEGKVEVVNSANKKIILKPGKKAVLYKSDNSLDEEYANIEETIAWKNGMFLFDNERIEDIMITLQRWYNIKVFYYSQKIKNKRFTLECKRNTDIKTILEYLKATNDVYFNIKGDVIRVMEM